MLGLPFRGIPPVFFAEAAKGEFLLAICCIREFVILIHYGYGTSGGPFIGDENFTGSGVEPPGSPLAWHAKGGHAFPGTIDIRHITASLS
jgi:hypothetical protein